MLTVRPVRKFGHATAESRGWVVKRPRERGDVDVVSSRIPKCTASSAGSQPQKKTDASARHRSAPTRSVRLAGVWDGSRGSAYGLMNQMRRGREEEAMNWEGR